MKRLPLIIAILFICIYQSEAKVKQIPGYYISKSRDTVKVTFKIKIKTFSGEPDYESLQWGIEYYDSFNQLQLLTPTMVREISFEYSGVKNKMLARGFVASNPVFFLQLVQDGKLKLFKHYTKTEKEYYNGISGGGGTILVTTVSYIMQKDTANLFQPGDERTFKDPFAQDVANYLSDCPNLAKKIEQGIYARKDIEWIVEEYNMTCGK